MRGAKQLTDGADALIAGDRPNRPCGRLRPVVHGPQLVNGEAAAMLADTDLGIECRPPRGQFDQNPRQQNHWRGDDQAQEGQDKFNPGLPGDVP